MYGLKIFTIIYLSFIVSVRNIQGSYGKIVHSDEENVMAEILKDYNKHMPPVDKGTGRARVGVELNLIQIISVSEKKEEMATSVFLGLYWNDDRLKYNASQHGGVNVSRIPADDLWVPDLILQNSKDKDKFDVSLRTDVLVYDSGKMEWLPPALYTSSCEIDVELFPFDTQNCTMNFRSISLSSNELSLYGKVDKVTLDMKVFVQNGEWNLISSPAMASNKSRGGVVYDEITFYFVLRRKPQFYIMNLLVPCILMMTFSCFTFFLPAVSGEKMTLSVSTLLGETVFLFLIAQRMPETSRSVPLIAVYLIFSMALIILCVVLSVIVCNVHYRSAATHRMPPWIKVYILGHLAGILRMERPPPSSPWQLAQERRNKRNYEMNNTNHNSDKQTWISASERLFNCQADRLGFRRRHDENQITGFTDVIYNESGIANPESIPALSFRIPKQQKQAIDGINYVARTVKNEQIKGQSSDDWQFCAAILDRLFFCIYTSLYIIGTLGFCGRVALASHSMHNV